MVIFNREIDLSHEDLLESSISEFHAFKPHLGAVRTQKNTSLDKISELNWVKSILQVKVPLGIQHWSSGTPNSQV